MDNVFHPNERAWISDTFKLDEAFEKLNAQVKVFESASYFDFNENAQRENNTTDETSTVNLSDELSEFLSKCQGQADDKEKDFFKVKIKDDEMYTNYNYQSIVEEEPNYPYLELGNQISNFNKELDPFYPSESSEDDSDTELQPDFISFGTQNLKSIMEIYHDSSKPEQDDNLSGSDEEIKDANVLSDSEVDEELVGPTITNNNERGSTVPLPAFDSTTPLKMEEVPKTAAADANNDEFKEFNAWGYKNMNKRLEEREEHQQQILKNLKGEERDRYEMMLKAIDPQLASVPGETFQDDPVKKLSSMPLLAAPLSKRAKSTLQSLAIYITHQDDPTGFHWKSSTVQQQINEDIRKAAFNNRITARKHQENSDVETVDMENDFFVNVSFFHPKEKDNAAIDGIHKHVKSKEETEIVVGGRASRRPALSKPQPKPETGGAARYLEPKLAMELTVLSTNTLVELRDALLCDNDLVILEEVENVDDYLESEFDDYSAKKLFPSGMLLIDDVIYNDSRENKQPDFRTYLNRWILTKPSKGIGFFKCGDMATTKIKDLTLRFGYPYVYIHQGLCEHIIVFNQARKLHPRDYCIKSAYPFIDGQTTFRNVNCRVDNEYIARWAVLDYDRFPENPMLVCTQCLKNYCYDQAGEKIGSFKLHPFRQVANKI